MLDRIRVLLVDDDEDDFIIARDIMDDIPGRNYVLEWAPSFKEAIEIITMHWSPSCFSVWSSTWYLFQACMVPLLSVSLVTKASQLKDDTPMTILDSCRATLNKAQELFGELRPWMKSADRGPDVISGLQEGVFAHASPRVDAATSDANETPVSYMEGDAGLVDSSWESLLTDYEWLLDDTLYGF